MRSSMLLSGCPVTQFVVIAVGMLRSERTPHAKMMRRLYGDGSGMCRFADKYYVMATDGIANTLTAGIDKFNLLCLEYEF